MSPALLEGRWQAAPASAATKQATRLCYQFLYYVASTCVRDRCMRTPSLPRFAMLALSRRNWQGLLTSLWKLESDGNVPVLGWVPCVGIPGTEYIAGPCPGILDMAYIHALVTARTREARLPYVIHAAVQHICSSSDPRLAFLAEGGQCFSLSFEIHHASFSL